MSYIIDVCGDSLLECVGGFSIAGVSLLISGAAIRTSLKTKSANSDLEFALFSVESIESLTARSLTSKRIKSISALIAAGAILSFIPPSILTSEHVNISILTFYFAAAICSIIDCFIVDIEFKRLGRNSNATCVTRLIQCIINVIVCTYFTFENRERILHQILIMLACIVSLICLYVLRVDLVNPPKALDEETDCDTATVTVSSMIPTPTKEHSKKNGYSLAKEGGNQEYFLFKSSRSLSSSSSHMSGMFGISKKNTAIDLDIEEQQSSSMFNQSQQLRKSSQNQFLAHSQQQQNNFSSTSSHQFNQIASDFQLANSHKKQHDIEEQKERQLQQESEEFQNTPDFAQQQQQQEQSSLRESLRKTSENLFESEQTVHVLSPYAYRDIKVIGHKAKSEQMYFVVSFFMNPLPESKETVQLMGQEQRGGFTKMGKKLSAKVDRTHNDFKRLRKALEEELALVSPNSSMSLPMLPKRIKTTGALDKKIIQTKIEKFNRLLLYIEFNKIESEALDRFLTSIGEYQTANSSSIPAVPIATDLDSTKIDKLKNQVSNKENKKEECGNAEDSEEIEVRIRSHAISSKSQENK